MELLVSAITGELAARSVSFLVDRYVHGAAAPTTDGGGKSLQRLLLRARVIVEEAERRLVTSHAMLRQLDVLRGEMYRGHHALDHHHASGGRRDAGDGEVSRHRRRSSTSSAMMMMSRFNRTKRVCLVCTRGGSGDHDASPLQQALGRLEAILADAAELVTFLTRCPPRLDAQPYSTYLILDSFMFGRQMEMERLIAFLLQEQACHGHGDGGARNPGVLTILGPRRAGKSTLVEHACRDPRVRNHFSHIVSLTPGDLGDDDNTSTIQHRQHDEKRVLVIVHLDGDRNMKGQDNRAIIQNQILLTRFLRRIPCASKIIVTSRSDKIAVFGTATEPLRLRPITQEAFWYFFKVRAFGSTDPAEHPRMASIAMDMAAEMDASFAAADIFGGLLRSNFNARFWSLALAVLREFKKKNIFKYDDDPHQTEAGNCWEATTKPASYANKLLLQIVYFDDYQINCSKHGEVVPQISLQDILFGGARPQGKIDVLGWKSSIPPHYSYAYSLEIRRPERMVVDVAKKKRARAQEIDIDSS